MKKKSSPVLGDIGEKAFLDEIRKMFDSQAFSNGISLGMGDDAAVLDIPGPLTVSTDSLVEDVHFKHDWIGPRNLGLRAMAVNLSDLAAMAAVPVGALIALNVHPTTPLENLRHFFRGVRDASRKHACPLLGGDLTRSSAMCITVTVMGKPGPTGRFIRRSTARPGQKVYVTGWPGSATAGMALVKNRRAAVFPGLTRCFLKPRPRLKEALLLSRICPDLAMMDLSDGICSDARQIEAASGFGIRIRTTSLPVRPVLKKAAAELNVTNLLDWVMYGGEDYELLFTTGMPLIDLKKSFGDDGLKTTLHEIGSVMAGPGCSILLPDGRVLRQQDKTFRHF
jgi:thiamine-monophosphate kinase